MSDEELSPKETLLKRHRMEKKDLQAKIQGLKKAASKGDKKRKKEVNDEIGRLESELKLRHDAELEELEEAAIEVGRATESLGAVRVEEDHREESAEGGGKVTKAQKRRDKKAQKELEREAEILAAEEEAKTGPRLVEHAAILKRLKDKNLALHEVPSNGDCMFAAVCKQCSKEVTVDELRRLSSEELINHPEEYRPFLTDPRSGDELSDAQYEEYCSKLATDSAAWGSQIELKAISKILNLRVVVVQGEGPDVVIEDGDAAQRQAVTVTYHRRYFGLGEHYNSTKPLEAQH